MADGITTPRDLEIRLQIVDEELEPATATATSSLTRKDLELGLQNVADELEPATSSLGENMARPHRNDGLRLQRSNSLPLSRGNNGDPSQSRGAALQRSNSQSRVTYLRFGAKGEIVPATPKPDHAPEIDFRSIKLDLYGYAFLGKWCTTDEEEEVDVEGKKKDTWPGAKYIYDKYPELVSISLTANWDTALHVAVNANESPFVDKLVQRMSTEDLEKKNKDGKTAFCMAAILGHRHCLKLFMTQKNEKLPLIPDYKNMLPVHFAAFAGHREIVQDLTSEMILEKMASERKGYIERLFLMTINSNMYDVAFELLLKYPDILVIARDDEEKTALHMLAHKPFEESKYTPEENNKKAGGSILNIINEMAREIFSYLVIKLQAHQKEKNKASSGEAYKSLLKNLWSRVERMEGLNFLDLVNKPSPVMFDAVKSGNIEVLRLTLYSNLDLLNKIKDDKGRNLLHVAALYRRKSIFNLILTMKTAKLLIREVDNDYNNVLHLAASETPDESQQNIASESLRPNLQMYEEILWFKEIEKKVPRQLMTMKNKKGKTPKDIFCDAHRKLSREVKDAAIGIANSGMIVAILIVSVAFAAAVTTPGDNYKTNNWYKVFILANAVAIFTSSSSIVSFLSIFDSSRFTDIEYIISMHPSVKVGLILVLNSIAAMVVAFVAASLLIFEHTSKWIGYVVAFLGIIPITIIVFQFSHPKGLIDYLFWSKYYGLSKVH